MVKLTISMVRLPIPGSDDGKWGEILNQYLSVSLGVAGELKQDTVGRDQLQADSVTGHAIANDTIETAHLADGAVTGQKLATPLQESIANKVSGPSSVASNAIAVFNNTNGSSITSVTGATISGDGELNVSGVTVTKAGTSRLKIDGSNGNVGIGSANPVAKLDVGGSLLSSPIISSSNMVAAFSANTNAISGIAMTNASTGGAADFRFTIQDSTNHYLAFSSPGTGNSEALFGVNKSTADYIFNAGGTARSLIIGTVEATSLHLATTNQIRLTLNSAGRLGIGTQTPGYNLHVVGDQGITGNLNFLSNNKGMYFDANNFIGHSPTVTAIHVTSGASLYLNIDSNDNSSNTAFIFAKDRTSNTGGTQLMHINESGNVGIGTMTVPSEKLDVDGNVKVSGSVSVGGVQQANVHAGTTAPANPVVGQVWIDTSGI